MEAVRRPGLTAPNVLVPIGRVSPITGSEAVINRPQRTGIPLGSSSQLWRPGRLIVP